MKKYFRYITGVAGRWLRGFTGLIIAGWGYSGFNYPTNIVLIVIGSVILLAAIFNLSLLGPLFGYPVSGKRISERYGNIDGVPGEDHSGKIPKAKST
ncbi:MAG: DUF2892 domain-containing protein [Bacteroidetes bacterium]|nr:DUF2892 domain-containing protein [Bacteroidota bacterium]